MNCNPYTPGPWTYDRTTRRIGTTAGVIATLPDNRGTAGIGHNLTESEQEANAQLITAAPELLDALVAILDEDAAGIDLERYQRAWEAVKKACH